MFFFFLSILTVIGTSESFLIGQDRRVRHGKVVETVSPMNCLLMPLKSSSVIRISTRIFFTNNAGPESYDLPPIGAFVEIPVIGPLLDMPKPLIIGESTWLAPPTPLQWKTIETCLEAQKKSLQQESTTIATIDHAPLVAVLHRDGKDHCTIAAIAGIVTERGSIDTSDAESFRESLASLTLPYYSDSSRVRVMGIGRARLSRFSVQCDGVTPNLGHSKIEQEEREDKKISSNEPLLVARMQLLVDSNENGKASSPVHALNQLGAMTSRIRFLHTSRQKIVRGLQAAQFRLEMAMEGWQDWDGIGSLFESKETDSIAKSDHLNEDLKDTLNSFLQEFNCVEDVSVITSHPVPLSPGASKCIQLENFGLGGSKSAYADLTAMAEVLVEELRPYYRKSDAEEFFYEAFSWAALESLKACMTNDQIAEALKTINTSERLELLYQAMLKHKMELNELAKAKSKELRDCGEECSLF
jgi:hypothetical protein